MEALIAIGTFNTASILWLVHPLPPFYPKEIHSEVLMDEITQRLRLTSK